MSELNTPYVYDSTSDLYKSLGCCLLSEDCDSGIHDFYNLTDKIVQAIINPNCMEEVSEAIKETFKQEYNNENYGDFPILECTDYIMSVLDSMSLSEDEQGAKDSLNECIENCIKEGISELFEENIGFNPNPYGNPYNECPYDIMQRNVTRGLIRLDEAETDEEICESLINLGRLSVAMEQRYYVDTEGVLVKRAVTEGILKRSAEFIKKHYTPKEYIQPNISGKELISKLPNILKTISTPKTKELITDILSYKYNRAELFNFTNNDNEVTQVTYGDDNNSVCIYIPDDPDKWNTEDGLDIWSEVINKLCDKLYQFGYSIEIYEYDINIVRGVDTSKSPDKDPTMESFFGKKKYKQPTISGKEMLNKLPSIIKDVSKTDHTCGKVGNLLLKHLDNPSKYEEDEAEIYRKFISNNAAEYSSKTDHQDGAYCYIGKIPQDSWENEDDYTSDTNKFSNELDNRLYKYGYHISSIDSESIMISKGAKLRHDSTVMESSSVAKKAREMSRSANKKEAGFINKVGGTMKQVAKAGKEAVSPMEKFINNATTKIKEADKNERRNIIIKGGMFPKVWRWLKRSIPLVVGGTVGTIVSPVAIATAIAFIGWIASDKYLDARERAKLLKELEDEIQIVNEKIDDSRGDENKQKKYELMRIRNDLKRTQDKIRLGLKY